MSKNYTTSFVVFASSVEFFYNTAKKFKDDAISLKGDADTCTPSFHLLSSLAIELLPKVLINRLTLRSCRREQLKGVAGGYPPAREAR